MDMKKWIWFSGILVIFLSTSKLEAQDCKKFHLYGPCQQYAGPKFEYDGQSRSNVIGYGDKLIYSMIFYGEREYKLFFCTSEEFYPVHFKLIDPVSRELLYDNKEDNYSNDLSVNIEKTQRIMIELSVLAHEASPEVKRNFLGCSGLLMQWRPVE
ncbi:MAG: hypothetical protein ACOCZL_00500 [Bacteroidota bacterium]